MANNGKVSVIIPTYNEKENVALLIKELKSLLSDFEFEIVVVDDNSPDGTYRIIIEEFKKDKRVKAILRENKRGLGTAILHGIKNSKYPVIIGMDADFNHPPELLPELLKELGENDLVVASRFIKGGGMEEKKRYFPTFIFNKFLKHVLGFPTMDNMSGFYAIKREKLLILPVEKVYKGYGEYHLRLVYLAKKKGLSIKELPVFYRKRKYGQSKSNLSEMFFVYLKEAFKLRLFKIMGYKIPVSKPDLTEEDFKEIKRAFDSSWISSKSPWVLEFEKSFAKKVSKTKYAASVNSGTSALFLALRSLGIGEGDEVILPSLTMIATINAVTLTGAKPVLVDCKSFEDFNWDIDEVKKKITKKTKAIIPVHLYGYSCEMDKLTKLAKGKNIFVVEDAAEAMGATYKGKALGSFGDLSCFSLYSNKIITTANGGMVTTNNKKLYELIKKLRFFDFNEDSHFTHHVIGYNLVLSGLQAALGVSQVKRFEKLLAGRREIFNQYKKYLKKSDNYFIPESIKYQNPNYWFPAVIFKSSKTKEKARLILKSKRIETRVFFRPLHSQPVYKNLFKGEKYEKAEYFYKHGLLLPSFYGLKENQIKEIAKLIDSVV